MNLPPSAPKLFPTTVELTRKRKKLRKKSITEQKAKIKN